MQTVPSLIGAGTAVAAAATGLAFGELTEEQSLRPNTSKRRSIITDRDFLSVFSSRPGTTSSAIPTASNNDFMQDSAQQSSQPSTTSRQRNPRDSSQTQIIHTKYSFARHPSTRQADFTPATPITEDSRDSLSSSSSWIRRLSIRPLSQHGSFRSSVGPDSPSITFSHGSGAPILSPVGHPPPQPPRNKLVKRASAANGGNSSPLVRRGSKTQMTLRRPATSHQRSATLHQQVNDETLQPLPDITLDQSSRPRAQTLTSPAEPNFGANKPSRWKSFWHSRITRSPAKSSPLRGNDGTGVPGIKRVSAQRQNRQPVYLVVPGSLAMGSSALEVPTGDLPASENQSNSDSSPQSSAESSNSSESPEGTPAKQPRRSISMHFTSTSNWIPKTGSIRRRKRGETVCETKRHVSAPATTGTGSTLALDGAGQEEFPKGIDGLDVRAELSIVPRPATRKRNTSSPLPPINRLSSFHIDLNKFGSLSPSLQSQFNDSATNTAVTPRTVSNTSQARTLERASTTGSSEYYRGFMSGDDDDTDFKTDTPFDSIRTAASVCQKGLDSPLESMFDESPPSTTGHNIKPKRLSIQDILGPSFDGGNKIMEEDEGISTPIRGVYSGAESRFLTADFENGNGFGTIPPSPSFVARGDTSRFSLDDDDDLDWDKEDDNGIYNHLSPPGSMNSRKGSPSSRPALANINGNINIRTKVRVDSTSERPRSTVFDWAEPMAHEKYDDVSYMRPKTVHGKQEIDMRGGRSASRKGPVPAHVRSQSVPIVPELSETATSTPKFGTWGLGQKNVSEDWDDDFEFEEEDVDGLFAGTNEETKVSMVVPASIQATQPTIRAHSGQIRELSLLVNDLKRLCRLGREMDMLGGSSVKLWREAEGIIALASPDEDPAEAPDSKLDSSDAPRLMDQDFDGASNDPDRPSRVTESQRNAVVRDRPSGRRRSVFSPEDDIFGTWDHVDEPALDRPATPENQAIDPEFGSTSVARSVMESMQPRHSKVNAGRESSGKLNFDTNSLKELVKRASDLRDGLSDLVRKADHITPSPVRTPKHTRSDGSPAFTRVFDDPTSSPTRRIPHSQSSNSILSSGSVGASPSTGLNQRMQMMTVS
ncbi:hypothetical protein F5Y11DRAFT_88780 [Daldinia sp. FL1419]|nr:hypothetical protein F5Y11DRAFT_88780 [Daldinia sp. FL1419]